MHHSFEEEAGQHDKCDANAAGRQHCMLTDGALQVLFSKDGNFLYTGARRDTCIQCWDIRSTQNALYTIQRDTPTTNQRISFDIEPCGRHLATGVQCPFVLGIDRIRLSMGKFVGSLS